MFLILKTGTVADVNQIVDTLVGEYASFRVLVGSYADMPGIVAILARRHSHSLCRYPSSSRSSRLAIDLQVPDRRRTRTSRQAISNRSWVKRRRESQLFTILQDVFLGL